MSVSETVWLATATLINHRVGVRTLLTPMPLPTPGAPSLWALQVAASDKGDGGAAQQDADRSGFGGMNAGEQGLFGFPAFSGRRNDPGWAAKEWPVQHSH
jgi:hypothetical protein